MQRIGEAGLACPGQRVECRSTAGTRASSDRVTPGLSAATAMSTVWAESDGVGADPGWAGDGMIASGSEGVELA